jgi:hypothetical protein
VIDYFGQYDRALFSTVDASAPLLPLKTRLESASRSAGAGAEADHLQVADMAVQVGRLQKIGMP